MKVEIDKIELMGHLKFLLDSLYNSELSKTESVELFKIFVDCFFIETEGPIEIKVDEKTREILLFNPWIWEGGGYGIAYFKTKINLLRILEDYREGIGYECEGFSDEQLSVAQNARGPLDALIKALKGDKS